MRRGVQWDMRKWHTGNGMFTTRDRYASIMYRLFEVVNSVATTHPSGQKRCRSRDACQITFVIKKISGMDGDFLLWLIEEL